MALGRGTHCAGAVVSDPTLRIVVIDDHEMILQSVVRLLMADAQLRVVGTAMCALDGIEVIRREKPDVVVLDFHLADMDAPEVIAIIREFDAHVKIVTFSGTDRPGAFYASMRAGSSSWVRKTRAIQELRDAIKHAAQGRPFVSEEIESQPRLEDLVLHYQPVVALDGGAIVGFEALVRWQHPERGLVYPESFLLLAEQTGYVEEIDRWVRAQAVAQLAQWQRRFPSTPRLWMSVNVSGVEVASPGLFQSIVKLLAYHGVSTSDLIVELTESVLLDDSSHTVAFMDAVCASGIGLALDDFGTGFSSVSYLRRFPFDHLKLDISFTAELPYSLRSMLMVEEIAHLVDSMKMTGIAEGIERQDQLEALRAGGWTHGQGYLFSPPVSASACDELLTVSTLLTSLV